MITILILYLLDEESIFMYMGRNEKDLLMDFFPIIFV